jgi:polysaccharide export outer membrane protein
MPSAAMAQAQAQVAATPAAPPAAPPAATGAGAAASAPAGYRLGPDDEIKVAIYGQPDLSVTTRVKADGTVRLAMLGAIDARGKTTAELADTIARGYAAGGYLTNPSVNVEVSQFVSRFVTVLGNVPQAGNYPLDRPYTVAAMLAKAGGATATGANAIILTPADGSGPVRISLADMGAGAGRPLQPRRSMSMARFRSPARSISSPARPSARRSRSPAARRSPDRPSASRYAAAAKRSRASRSTIRSSPRTC